MESGTEDIQKTRS